MTEHPEPERPWQPADKIEWTTVCRTCGRDVKPSQGRICWPSQRRNQKEEQP